MTEEPREVQGEPQVLEGDDSVPRQPASPIDPYTPAAHARGAWKARDALRFAWIPVLIVVAIVVWAAVR
jgi:hypothetical protein